MRVGNKSCDLQTSRGFDFVEHFYDGWRIFCEWPVGVDHKQHIGAVRFDDRAQAADDASPGIIATHIDDDSPGCRRFAECAADLGNDNRQIGIEMVALRNDEANAARIQFIAGDTAAEIRLYKIEINQCDSFASSSEPASQIDCNLAFSAAEMADEYDHRFLKCFDDRTFR